MALFKIAKGNRNDLPARATEGYAYFCKDTGEFFVDILSTDESTENNMADFLAHPDKYRVQINASKLIHWDPNSDSVDLEISPEDIFTTDTIIPIANGGTGANTRDNAITNLALNMNVYEVEITNGNWVGTSGNFTYSWTKSGLKCGLNGDVPPIIHPHNSQGDSDIADYSKINQAVATAGSGIVFKCNADQAPQSTLHLTVLDFPA